uniref:R-linalool synthase QH1, chloroplastic-like n=1 Tax=Erigeron canadensis TaxID=72917 RepID=UPI001CB95265|nr:R-linalool synthase QH1, chloroplastic-like [Erigeron canadensis]
MASIYISCPGIGFARPRSHETGRRNIQGIRKQLYSTNPTTMAVTTDDTSVLRRSANYPPSLWSYDFLQSLTNNYYLSEKYETKLDGLKELVKTMISECNVMEDTLSTLELVDDLQRLGISYHFKDEIRNVLKSVYMCYFDGHVNYWNKLDLNLKALGFRLLRQHGYRIPQEIFEDIKDETGNIKVHVGDDIVGVLNLYEASFFAVVDENILDEIREFTIQCLEKKLEQDDIINIGKQSSMSMLISHALELPLLWRPQRFEPIWFIEAYKRRNDMNPSLLELAELDFNIVQGIHREDLKYSSRWWDSLGWHKKFSFARDRLVESFMWAVGASYQPSFSVLRRNITKLISLINVIDDVYDVYGTLDELKQFTDAVRRWDTNAIEELPDYMKICFLGFYNTINEMAYNTLLANQEILVLPYVKKVWADYCDAILLEAQWFHSGYTPSLDEYLKNSCVTISVPAILSNIYHITSSDLTGEALQNIVHCSSMILRLADDLGTSTAELERGDVPKSIQCYMHETGASEEKAREHIKKLIIQTWKKLNQETMSAAAKYDPSASEIFVECATNLGRMGQFTYKDTDVFGTPDDLYKSHQISLLFTPKS